MTDSLVPDWIKNIQYQQKQQVGIDQHKRDRQALLEKTIKADGAEFWKRLLKELQITVDSLGSIGLMGKLSEVAKIPHEGVQVSVVRSGVFTFYVNLFFDDVGIRYHPQVGNDSRFSFCLGPTISDATLMVTEGASPMTAEQVAQAIIQPIVEAGLNKVGAGPSPR